MKRFVFNGWAAGPEMWNLCAFARDRVFDYVELLDGAADAALESLQGLNLDSSFLEELTRFTLERSW